jgi:hypothetical protein
MDFEGNPGGYDDDAHSALEELNKEYVCMLDNGKFRIMYQQMDHVVGRPAWINCDRQSFETMYCNRTIQRDITDLSRNASRVIPLGEAWIKWPARRQLKGVCFEPETGIGDMEKDGWLNLWSGYAHEYRPDALRKGSWSYLKEMIHVTIANGNDDVFNYMLNWMAFMIQKPATVCETAVVLRGPKGIGKGTLGNALVKLIGQHAHAIGSSEQLTGRFNDHMRNLIFLFADEATSPYDRAAEAKLRHLITEPFINVEKKGVDTVRVKNLLHIMMASNDKWVVPQSADERRFFIQNVNDKWKGKQDRWNALHAELNKDGGSGFYAMMAELMTREFPVVENGEWHPRDFPRTTALREQQILSLDPMARFWHNALTSRVLPVLPAKEGTTWESGRVSFFVQDFSETFAQWCRSAGMTGAGGGRSNLSVLMRDIKDVFPSAHINRRLMAEGREDIDRATNGTALAVTIPSLRACALEFEAVQKLPGEFGKLTESEFG